MSEDNACIICYAAAPIKAEEMQALLARANIAWCGCKLAICERCWLDDCRMLCPVCQRQELNTKRQCHVCLKTFHLREVDACDVCSLGTCRDCKQHNSHACGMLHFCSFVHLDTPSVESLDELVGRARDAENSGCGFCAIGCASVSGIGAEFVLTLLKDEVGDVGFTLLMEPADATVAEEMGMQAFRMPWVAPMNNNNHNNSKTNLSIACRQFATSTDLAHFLFHDLHLPPVAAIEAVDA